MSARMNQDPLEQADNAPTSRMTSYRKKRNADTQAPLFRIFDGSRVAISNAVGPMFKRKRDAALTAYQVYYSAWEECFRYYNNNHVRMDGATIKGRFRRGDNTENIVYSNVNTVLPAIYNKNPDITCNTADGGDADFARCLKNVLAEMIKRRAAPGINMKPKMKKAAMMAELTNYGVLKLEWEGKDTSREAGLKEMERLTGQLENAKPDEVDAIYGQLMALEQQVEVSRPSGPALSNILPSNHLVDPNAEMPDGTDAEWHMERAFLPTLYLRERFTQKDENGEPVLVYKPTHFANLSSRSEDDGVRYVYQKIGTNTRVNLPESYTTQERLQYLYQYMTEVWWVWDKTTKRVYLFSADDWTWPIWVWEDPYNLTRFFPYFILGFTMSTGGVVTPGEVTYYLDQQDEINAINKEAARVRKSFFNYFFYNSNVIDPGEVAKFVRALTSHTLGAENTRTLGVKIDENRKLSEVFEAVVPPSGHFKELFDKSQLMATIDRISSTSDALRGTQFKANTNEDAVQAYMDATRLKVGAKIDCIEDVMEDVCTSLAELAVQNADEQMIAGLIGRVEAANWRQMDVATFNAMHSIEIVAGSVEKPTSVFKKKEAVQVAQAIGQFANSAPGATLKIILRLLQQAFTEVVIHPEDWDSIEQEVAAQATKGVSAPGSAQTGPQLPAPPNGAPSGTDLQQQGQQQPQGPQPAAGGASLGAALMQLPARIKMQAMQMRQRGIPDAQIIQFLREAVAANSRGPQVNEPPQRPLRMQPITPQG